MLIHKTYGKIWDLAMVEVSVEAIASLTQYYDLAMGCIHYNLVLSIRQLSYPMRRVPSEESITPFITRGFGDPNVKILQGVWKACGAMQRNDKELRESSNGITNGYHKWLRVQTKELDWLPKLKAAREEQAETPEKSKEVQTLKAELERAQVVKEKFKSTAINVRKEYVN